MKKSIELFDPVLMSEPDTASIKRLEVMLEQAHPKLVGMDGEEMLLPDFAYQVLRQVTHLMAAGRSISLISHDHYLSSQEAAEFLNVSRPYLYSLLDQAQIPFIKVGTHRRIRFEDLVAYKERRDAQRHQSLGDLVAFSQELGFYETTDDSSVDQ